MLLLCDVHVGVLKISGLISLLAVLPWSRRCPLTLLICSFLLNLLPQAAGLKSGAVSLRSSKQTRAKWSFPPQDVQAFSFAGQTFHGWAPRRSPHQKHVPGSLRSFIWLCLRPVQWTSSSIPLDESAINLLVCLADSMALASATTSGSVFFVLSSEARFSCGRHLDQR